MTQPAIEGKDKGIIISKTGTFNFYDGKITAIGTNGNKAFAFEGSVSDTPTAYNTSITDGEDVDGEKTKVATLAIIAGVEAKIGKTTYPRLEDAIDAAGKTVGADGTQVEIVLVPEVVTKSEKIVISEDKNIKLDLNGRTLNTTGSDYVIENCGKLEIVDTSDEESGKITSTTNHTIHNGSTTDEEKMYADEPENINLNGIEHNSEDQYFFEYKDGILINNNKKSTEDQALNTAAAGYIKLDMTKYKGKYTLFVDAEISTYSSYGGYGYVSISNKPDNSSRVANTTYGQFMRLTNEEKKTGTIDIAGGQIYYLNFRYEKGYRVNDTRTDEFKINSIKIRKKQEGELTLTSGEIAIDMAGDLQRYHSAIYNEGMLNVNGGKISSNSIYTAGVMSWEGSSSNINGGVLNLTGNEDIAVWAYRSGSLTKVTNGEIHAYHGVYTSTYTSNVEITGGTLGEDCYYQIHSYGSYSSIKIDGVELSKSGNGYNIYLHVNYCDVSINDCDITNSNSNYVIYNNNNYNNIEIKNSEIDSKYGIYSYRYSNLIIDTCNSNTTNIFFSSARENNCQIKDSTINVTGNDRLISCGTEDNLTIINTKLNNEYSSNKYEGININSGGTINIKGTSEIKSAGAPIYSYGTSKVDVNIESGTLESTYWQAIEMVNTTGTITLGEKGDEVKTDTPVLKSAVSQWDVHSYRMNLRFYDGRLIGGRNKLVGVTISDIEDGYELVDIDDEDSGMSQGDGSSETTAEEEVMTLGKTQGVAKVLEDNSDDGSEYDTLQSAVESCEATEGKTFTIKLLKDVNQATQIKIKEEQNIKIDLNGHKIYAMTNNTIYNEGTLEIIDSKKGEDYNVINSTGATIIYNATIKNEEEVVDGEDAEITDNKGNLTIGEGVHIYYNASGMSNELKSVVKNEGNMISKDAKMTCDGTYVYLLENMGTAELQGGNITTNAENDYGLCNGTNGNLKVKDTVIICNRLYSYGIYNREEGTVEINENANIQAIESTAVYNKSIGKIILNGGTVSSRRSAVFYNEGEGEIEIVSGTIKSEGTYTSSSYAINNYNGGTVSIKGGDITSIASAVYNTNANKQGTINIEGGIIKSTNGSAVYNRWYNTSGTIYIKDATMTSESSHAIYNQGTIYMISGEAISNGSNGIYNNGGSVYLGSKIIENSSEEEPDRETPKVVGKECGVYNTGTTGNFYFYDGAITGAIGKSISGNITEKESGYQIVTNTDEDNNIETSTLQRITIAKIGESANIENGEKISNISELQKKLDSLDETKEYTVKVLTDFSIGASEDVIIKENSKVVLDLNGCTISSDVNNTIENKGTLTIRDSTTDGLGCISNGGSGTNNAAKCVIKNEAKFNFESGTIKTTGAYGYGIYNYNSGNTVITGGKITTSGSYGYGVYNRDEGIIEMRDTAISTSNEYAHAVANFGKQTIKINNSEISISSSYGYGVYNDAEGTVEINENTNIQAVASTAVYNRSTGKIILKGGTVSSKRSAVFYNEGEGEIEIVSGTIKSEGTYTNSSYAINNYNGGTVSIKDGDITSIASAVYNTNANKHGIIKIEGGTIKSTNGSAVYNRWYNTSGTIYIKDATMTSESSHAIYNQGTIYMISGEATSNTKDGIYNDGGSVYLGNNEKLKETLEGIITQDEEQTGQVNNENPKIVGKDYGVYSTGTFYYYDGMITGSTGKSVNSNITDKETEYQVIKRDDAENGTETVTLEKVEIMEMDGREYNTIKEIQSAIDGLNDNEQHTVKLIHDTYMCSSDNLAINEDKDIELDLNGYTLETSCDNTITNNGKLKITDGSEAKKGRMQGVAKVFIDNKKDLVVDEGEYDSTNYMSIHYDSKYLSKIITNTGNIKWEGAKILLNLGNNYGIDNQESGTINWKTGTIEANQSTSHSQYGIYTNSTGGIEWTGGEIILNSTITSYNQYGIYIEKSGNINIETMTFSNRGVNRSSYQYGIYSNNNSNEKTTITINDFQRKVLTDTRMGVVYGIGGNKLIVNIKNGNFIDCDYAISLNDSDINITEGNFQDKINIGTNSTAKIDNGTIGGIEVYGQLTINDGQIKSLSTKNVNAKITMNNGSILNENGNGVQLDYGEFTLLGGTIESTNSNGVYINYSGKFIMGDNTNAVITEVPQVKGNTYGVYVNSGEFNFYDGTITGNTKAIYGGVKNKPENYKVQYSDTDETVAFLDIDAEVEKIVSVDGVYFSDFESALDHAMNNGTGTILVHKEIVLPKAMTVDAGKDITINLNGHSLNAELADTIFTNNGTLTIIDEIVDETEDGDSDSADGNTNDGEEVQSVVSKIENTQGYVVINNYTLTVGRKGNELIKTTPVLKGQTTAIQNNGTFNWYDGVIDGNEITEEKTQSAIITSLARQIKAGADNMLKEAEKKILPLVQNPNIKVDKEFPIWTKGPVTATIYTTDRIILDIKNETANVETRSLTVKKVWEMPDEEAQNYKSTIQLMKIVNGKKEAVTDKKGNNLTVEIIGNHSKTFENIPVYKGKEKIEYVLEEIKVQRRTSEGEWEDVPMTDFSVTYKQMSN